MLPDGVAPTNCKLHLLIVYLHVIVSMVFCFLGSYLSLHVEALRDNLLPFIGTMMFFMILLFSPDSDSYELSILTLLLFAVFTGVLIRYPVQRLMRLDPDLMTAVVVETTSTFMFFTLWSLLSRNDHWLGLGEILLVFLNSLLYLTIINLFLESPWLHQLNIYTGFLINCAYVLYDTQLTLKQCQLQYKNSTNTQALNFFLDICGLFFHSLAITLIQRGEGWLDLHQEAE